MICVRRRAPGSKQGVEKCIWRSPADASAATAVEFVFILVLLVTLLTLDLGLLFIRDALLLSENDDADQVLLALVLFPERV